jgi:hypothetical protein
MIYNMVMMNLTDSAKNHFLNFFNVFFEQKKLDKEIKEYCQAEYKKDWEYAYACYTKDKRFPNSLNIF